MPTNGEIDEQQHQTCETDGEQQLGRQQPLDGPPGGRAGAGELLLAAW